MSIETDMSNIIDEQCRCNHPKSAHGGIGRCAVKNCDCGQYTWTGSYDAIHPGHDILWPIWEYFRERHPGKLTAGQCNNALLIKPIRPCAVIALVVNTQRETVILYTCVDGKTVNGVGWILSDPEWPRECDIIIEVFTDL